MIYLVLAVIFLHLISAPIVVSADVNVDTDKGDGNMIVRVMLIPVYKKKINTNEIKEKISGQSHDIVEDEEKTRPSNGKKSFLIVCAKNVLSRVRVRVADLAIGLGTGDAAADGVAVGLLKIMYLQACAFFGFEGNTDDIRPDFDNTVLVLSFFGIFSLCIADIIFAVCTAFLDKIRRGGKRRGYANVAE